MVKPLITATRRQRLAPAHVPLIPTELYLTQSSVPAGSPPGTEIGVLSADPVVGEYDFTLTDNAGGRFVIDGNSLQVGSVQAPGGDDPLPITVRATAKFSKLYYEKVFGVLVMTVVSPIELGDDTPSITEGSTQGTSVTSVSSPGSTITLSDDAGGRFEYDSETGLIKAGGVPTDYETATSHDITIQAEYQGDSIERTVTVQVVNVVEITNITLAAATIPENSAAGTIVGALASVPTGAILTLSDNAGNRFAIDGSNRLVAGSVATDYETATSHDVTVTATKGPDVYSKSFTVQVTNVNELTNITLGGSLIAENSAAGTVVGALASVIPGATFAVTAQTPAGTYFTVVNGNLVAGATPTNFEVNGTHSVTVTATKGTDTFAKAFTITVTNVTEITNFTLDTATIAENSVPGVLVGTFTSVPTGATYALAPDNATGTLFAISGNTLVAGATATDYETSTSHVVKVRATRLSEIFDKTFTITVTNVDELDNLTLTGAAIDENTAPGQQVGVLASDPPGATFTITGQVPNNTFFAISGNNLVTGSTVTNFEANASHQVTVQGQLGSAILSKTFTITINDVDEITDISLSTPSIIENATVGTAVGNLTSTPSGATFALTDNAGNRFQLVGSAIQAGTVATDYETATTHNIVVRGTRLGETLDKTIAITVTNSNELTNITLDNTTIAENTTQGTLVGNLASVIPGATFSITGQSVANGFQLNTTTNSRLEVGSAAPNFEGAPAPTVTILATRGTDTFPKTFTLTVTDVDEISDISLSTPTIAENTAANQTVGNLTSTPAGATFTLVSQSPNAAHFKVVGTTIQTDSVPTDFETATTHTVTVRGTRLGETLDKPLTISVTNVNELTDITLTNNSIAENSAQGTLVGTLASVIPGATFALTGQSVANGFQLISGNRIEVGSSAPNFEVSPSPTVTIQATRGTDVFNKTLTLAVTNVTEITDVILTGTAITENSAQNTPVGTLSSTPTGATFALSDNAGGRFQLVSGNQIQAGATPTDYETATSHNITVVGTRQGESLPKVIAITVTNANELTNITLDANSLAENSGQGTPVGNLASVPAGATFTLTDTAGGRFQLASGQLQAGTVATDYETATSHDVTVSATLGADTIQRTFTVNVTDVQDGFIGNFPDIHLGIASAQAGITGSAGTLYVFPHTYAEDPNAGTFSIVSDPSGLFALTGGRNQSVTHTAGVVAGQDYPVTLQVVMPTTSEVRTATVTIKGVAQGALRAGGSTFVKITGPSGGGNQVSASSAATGGTAPRTYAWTKDATLPLGLVSSTVADPTVMIPGGVNPGFYRGYFYGLITDNVGATWTVLQPAVTQVT